MDIGALIDSFATGSYQVTRRASAAPVRGVYGATTDSVITIAASVQPASGQDLLRLPEGRRTNLTRVIFTTTELLTGDAGAANEADLVTIDGLEWEVQHVERWQDSNGYDVGYRCIAQQPTSGAGTT